MYPEIRFKWQKKFDYIHVDEFQDVDKIQYDIIRFMVGENTLLCVVGDPDQTIYTWRGADVNLIMNYEKDFSPCTTIVLNENYRSTPSILKGANSVIQNNKNRIEKDLYTNLEDIQKIIHYSASEDELEPMWVADRLSKLKMEGNRYKDMAVHSYMNHPFEDGSTLRLIEDLHLEKSVSIESMSSNMEGVNMVGTKGVMNAHKREVISNRPIEDAFDFDGSIN